MKKYVSGLSSMNIKNLMVLAFILAISAVQTAKGQGDGARFYWKSLMGTNAIPVIVNSMGGNANPLDPSYNVIPGSNFKANMAMAGYAKMLPLGKRSAMASVIVPMGNITGSATLAGRAFSRTARGFGDPMLQFSANIIGPKAIMNIPDLLRYKPKFSVDLMASMAIPIGNYDSSSPINIGQNRWYGRIGAPVIWQIGAWVPGKRTTFEFLPVVWIYAPNNQYLGGNKLETSPMFQIEAHLTHDFMEKVWGSLDVVSYSGAKATINGGTEGASINNLVLGATLGYHINGNMQMNLSYAATINDEKPEDLKIDGFRMTLIFGWHSLVEGMNRLKGSE